MSADATVASAAELLSAGRREEAVEVALAAVAERPEHAASWRLAGEVQLRAGLPGPAELALRQAVALDPRDPLAHALFGRALRALGRYGEALAALEVALELQPGTELATELANACCAAGRPARAEVLHRRVALASPGVAAHWANLGNTLRQLGRVGEALAALDRALELEPDDASLRWNQALALLTGEHWRAGWAAALHRHRRAPEGPPGGWDRQWSGAAGLRVHLRTEQGFGDALMFVRFAACVAARGATAVVEAHPRLHAVLRTAPGVAEVVPPGATGAQATAWLMDLPHQLELEPHSYACAPYLTAEQGRVGHWGRALGGGLKVGVAWQGNPDYAADHLRSPALTHWAPLTALSGIRWIGLQKHVGLAQLAHSPLPIEDWGQHLDNGGQAFVDTAAALMHVDLLLTSDSAIAHLAGALGVETWLVLPHAADWRWGVGGSRSVFYPSMRLFRQPEPGDWTSVFRDVAVAMLGRQLRRQGTHRAHQD